MGCIAYAFLRALTALFIVDLGLPPLPSFLLLMLAGLLLLVLDGASSR